MFNNLFYYANNFCIEICIDFCLYMLSIIVLRKKIGIGYRYAASVLMEIFLKLIKLSFFVMYNKTI